MNIKRKNAIISTSIIVVLIIGLIIFNNFGKRQEKLSVFYEVTQGVFEITVENAGELSAEKTTDINGPVLGGDEGDDHGGGGRGGFGGGMPGGGMMRVSNLTIQDIVPEGTLVKKGDYVAQLDRTEYQNTLATAREELTNLQANLELAILDTALSLSDLRDAIVSQQYAVEEAQIKVDGSQYEAPATIRQREADLDKQVRKLEQTLAQYELKEKKILINIEQTRQKVEDQETYIAQLQEYISNFTITAPDDGMVIYKENMLGTEIRTGSSINAFENVVATLPDLTTMISTTHVSEVDVVKVEIGQSVQITVDAVPNKSYTGKVISIANVGETLSNSDTKMFEVKIQLNGTDLTLKPDMTTWNKILIKSYPDAVSVPLDCVYASTDGTQYVYKKNRTRQIVSLGEMNEKSYLVNEGLEPGTLIYIIPPEDGDNFRISEI
jgi:multidrug efflux pump subunit AcrA (membrane-fusion protein)